VHDNSYGEHQTSLGRPRSTRSHQSSYPVTRLFRDELEAGEVEFFDQQTYGGHIINHFTSDSWEMERFLNVEDHGLSSSPRVDQVQTNYQYPQNATCFETFSNARSDPSHEQFGSMPKSRSCGIMPTLAAIPQGILPQFKLLALMSSESQGTRPWKNQQEGLVASQYRTADVNDFYHQENESNIHDSLSEVFDLYQEPAHPKGVHESPNHTLAVPNAISTPFRSSPSVASSIQLSQYSVPNESVVDYANLYGAHFSIQQNPHFSAAADVEECNYHALRQTNDCFDYPTPQAASFLPIEHGLYESDDYERGMPFNEYGGKREQNGFLY
jgi:hypothetical protein